MRTKEQSKAYRSTLEYKARARENMRRWRVEHPGYQAAQDKKFYEKNRDKCRRKGREKWCNATPEKKAAIQERNRKGHLRRKYNLTPEAKEKMYQEQRGLCYLCPTPLISCSESVVEHSHYTNEVRGLAHHACNVRLGNLECLWHNDPQTLQRMMEVVGIEKI